MKIGLKIDDIPYQADMESPFSIAITLQLDGKQPNHFGAPKASSRPLQAGDFIGDTRRGGSCNVNILTLVPHCNGTHTETVAHIVNQSVPVFTAVKASFFPCVLVSITPRIAAEAGESYLPNLDPDNRVITRYQLQMALDKYSDQQLVGLAIRSLPNDSSKQTMVYDSAHYPVFLTNDAMTYLVERSVQHLLVDFPSVDKMYDDGLLSNHHLFWNVEPASHELSDHSWTNKTITEMIWVDNIIDDGFYLCDLQIAQINTEALPSRPLLFALSPQSTR